ncbi:hypothetical protein FQN60_012282 [Etheostoma spectabile]|uniref:NOTCH1 EGF-like calcium-binding domain-containing protein n=1 Tax=Etheostoma spectabile TaxID=54343 RepID=A0A5J5DNX8_9PERO|nr:hypothetical protein FQN60_012282 [Etheostoma spectabile]
MKQMSLSKLLWMWSIMGVPGVTYVSSCDSCHDKATCRESREIGDSFTTQRHSCVCKDGFVGDGLSCYNTKLCSNSSCCSQGYHWSPNSGCVDTDECSLPNSPCIAPQVCQNTQGSFECLGPSSRTRSGRSFQSVYFNCGNTVCPLGMDCISNNGVERCADPCEYYTRLNDDWRATNNTSNQNIRCDQNVNWVGWYRIFLGQTSAQIPERGEQKQPYSVTNHSSSTTSGPHHQSTYSVTNHSSSTNSDPHHRSSANYKNNCSPTTAFSVYL